MTTFSYHKTLLRRILQTKCCLFVLLLTPLCFAQEVSEPSDTKTVEELDLPLNVVQKPRWEFGVGGGFFSGFDYPASRDSNERALALPFFIYRTPVLRVGGGGVRAMAIERSRFTLDISVGGSLNASSEGNNARQGMPDLDFLFEVGPQLEYRLVDTILSSGERVQGRFTTELRAVFSTDFRGVDSQGFVGEIGVGFNVSNIRGTGIALIAGLDTTFATEPLQDYFYQVDPEFVTPDRALFDASGGYLETNLFTGLAFAPLPKVRVFTGIIRGFFDGASNQSSPLFEVREQTRFALGIVWTLATSKEMVQVVDLGSRN